MTTFTLQDGTVLREDDILKFNPETGKVHVEKPPQWTSTVPTESGWYWHRSRGPGSEMVVKIGIDTMRDGEKILTCWYVGSEVCLFREDLTPTDEWWPIPLTAPEE